jgi:hypothetical protein
MSSQFRSILHTVDFKKTDVRDHYFLPKATKGPAYVSLFRYGENFREYIESGNPYRDWRGLAYSDYIFFDFDCHPKKLSKLLCALRLFLENLGVQYGLNQNSLDICFTGMKGFSIGIPTRLFNFAPMISPEPFFKRLAMTLVEGLEIVKFHDINAHAPHRFVRLANSQHETTKLFKIPLSANEIFNLSIREIKTLAKAPRYSTELIKPSELEINDVLHEYWMETLDTTRIVTETKVRSLTKKGVERGMRHDVAFEIAKAYRDSGRSLNQCHVDLVMWNHLNRPPISDIGWFRAMLNSVYRHKAVAINKQHHNSQLQAFLRTINQFIRLSDKEFRAFITTIALTNTQTKQWEGIEIKAGSFICSIQSLADRTGGGVRKSHVRTLLDKLKKRGIVDTLKMPGNQGQLIAWRGKMANLFRENGYIHDA